MSFIFTSYFDRFPDFDHRPRRSIRIEFNRLAKAQKWDFGETKRERASCYNEELEGHFHRLGITDQLERLKHLCDELEVRPRNNVAGCRKAKELKEYSHKTNKFYPLDEAKGETIEVLLRRLK